MAKIMLVEDDNNLREIYGARLLAEGYEIVSAKDGEEALALAVKEKPDLIISDIMMPKISGFDMLDILRSTAETKHTKVIMMTALSQVEDKDRANRLGADRYLIKSQVTLEDVAKAAREVLGDSNEQGVVNPTSSEDTTPVVDTSAIPSTPTPTPVPTPVVDTSAIPSTPTPTPVPTPVVDSSAIPSTPTPTPVPTPVVDTSAIPSTPTPTPVPTPVEDNSQVLADTIAAMGGTPAAGTDSNPVTPPAAQTVLAPGEQSKTSIHTKVINPINDITQQGNNLEKLLAEEAAKEASSQTTTPPTAVVNDLTPPEVLQKQAEEAAAEAPLQPPTPIEPTT